MRGFFYHFWMTLRLNFRNPQAVVLGYLVPVFFLFAYAAFFVRGTASGPMLSRYLGQLMTLTVLGGACFGMPITVVSERERGVWRRYRLTPLPTGAFVLSVLLARYVLVLSAGLIQVGLAMGVYKMPAPHRPWELWGAFTVATFAFLGIGMLIAMIANSVQAVQALGQTLFLPMIMIAGVGKQLHELPQWARAVTAFLPLRYAVQAIDHAAYDVARVNRFFYRPELYGWFNYAALAVIGLAAGVAAARLFRWDNVPGQRLGARAWAWVALAVASWVAVGVVGRWYKWV